MYAGYREMVEKIRGTDGGIWRGLTSGKKGCNYLHGQAEGQHETGDILKSGTKKINVKEGRTQGRLHFAFNSIKSKRISFSSRHCNLETCYLFQL